MKAARPAEMNAKRVATGIRNIAFVGLYVLNQFENQTLGNP